MSTGESEPGVRIRMAAVGFFDDQVASTKALADRTRLVAEQEAAWAEVGMLEA